MPIYLPSERDEKGDRITNVTLADGSTQPGANIYLSSGAILQFQTPLNLSGQIKFKPSIHLFKNAHTAESNIHEIHTKTGGKSQRIGWIIPITALTSNEHGFGANEHFLTYARAAVYHLFMGFSREIVIERNQAIKALQTLSISPTEIYSRDTSVLVASRQTFPQEDVIHDYFYDLLKLGYIPYGSYPYPKEQFANAERNLLDIGVSPAPGISATKINIRKIAPILQKDRYITSVLGGQYDFNAHPLATFLVLYQILELLIERVYQNEQNAVVRRVIELAKVSDIKSAIHAASGAVQESARLNRLYSRNYINPLPDTEALRKVCESFVESAGRPKPHAVMDLLYDVRNTVVHEYRSTISISGDIWTELNFELLRLVIDCIIGYEDAGDLEIPYEFLPLEFLRNKEAEASYKGRVEYTTTPPC